MTGIECEKIGPLTLRAWGLLTALIVWTLYLLTLAPTVGFWDTSEYVTTAHIVGLPHPPGNPFFVIVGRVWDLLLGFTGLPVALRINALGATLSAGASFFWFLTVARIVARFRQDRREVLVASIVAVWIGATAFTVWTQSNLNEKVYPLSMFIVAVVSYLALVWLAEADTSRGNRLLILMALLLGLGWSNHTMSLLPGLALAAFVLLHRWRAPLNPRVLGLGIALLAVGYSCNSSSSPSGRRRTRSSTRRIRSVPRSSRPSPRSGSPTVTERARSPWRASRSRCRSFATNTPRPRLSNARRRSRRRWPTTGSTSTGSGRAPCHRVPASPRASSSSSSPWSASGPTCGTTGRRSSMPAPSSSRVTLLLVYYLNFRYGYSIYWDEAPGIAAHEVRERDYFFIIGFQLWGIYAGLGLVSLWGRWTASEPSGAPERPPGFSARHRKAAALLAVGLIPLVFNFTRADRSDERAARNWAHNMLQSVEPYAVLFTYGDNDTFPLWYLQEVEGIRRDVTVIVQSYLGTDWYHRQLRRLTKPCEPGESPEDSPTTRVCQRPFDPTTAPSLYAEADATTPTRAGRPSARLGNRRPPAAAAGHRRLDIPALGLGHGDRARG